MSSARLDPMVPLLRKLAAGRKTLLGVITCASTTVPVSSSTTAVPITATLSGEVLHLEADAACYWGRGASSALAIADAYTAAATGNFIPANEFDREMLLDADTHIAVVLKAAGTVNLRVWSLQ